MIPIRKSTEPPELTKLRKNAIEKGLSPDDAYKTLKGTKKEKVRNSLLHEQGQLCAYCMCRIPRNDVDADIAPIVIEHYLARNPVDGRDVGQGLDYNNLLAVCNGNRAGKAKKHSFVDLTCDAHRGNTEFRKINPCDPDTLTSIFYTMDGKIDSTDPDVKIDLIDTLNLNCASSPLVSEREASLSELLLDMDSVEESNLTDYCKSRLSVFRSEIDNKTPYQGILIWYLQSMLDALKAITA
ncbi:TIGR02646 family protein [Clostridium sp. MCC353]|uniref:retron system putative HNH endonuclease n=1 Tax=Clostridium sp. MCC353 TaxID=2592646 RepID=UPI001C027BEC|nr:retron system putative HNH endonuclease [Clostridium sp. MCC353]MBT9775874.1 TIGR02646 family protein [Clostridium sp. MCC353]